MPHFFINSKIIKDNKITVTDKELLNHLISARRVKIGEKILFLDENKIQYRACIDEINKNFLIAKIIKSYLSKRELKIDITVAKCVLKQDADFSSIQKATELGVKTIIPVISDNCAMNKKIVYAKANKFQKIADEAVKQCERADFPKVIEPIMFDELMNLLQNYDKVLIFSEREEKRNIKKYFVENPYRHGEKILIVIGCEGGFSKREFEIFEKNNLVEISLGKLIMRADTALTAAIFGVIQEIGCE